MKNQVIINEQHTLLQDQVDLLNHVYGVGMWERLDVPASGWTKDEMEAVVAENGHNNLIFASPIPLLIGMVAAKNNGKQFAVLYNDRREKKELPNGKIIMTVAQTGWQLEQF